MIKINKASKIVIVFAIAFVIIISFFLLQDLYELYLIERVEFLLNLRLETMYDYKMDNNLYDKPAPFHPARPSADMALDTEISNARHELNSLYKRVKSVENSIMTKTNILFVCIVLFAALAISIAIYLKDRSLIRVRKGHTHKQVF